MIAAVCANGLGVSSASIAHNWRAYPLPGTSGGRVLGLARALVFGDHEGAPAVHGDNQAALAQQFHGLADGVVGDAVYTAHESTRSRKYSSICRKRIPAKP